LTPTQRRILAVLRSSPTPVAMSDILEQADVSYDTFRSQLSLLNRGLPGEGVYRSSVYSLDQNTKKYLDETLGPVS
jgi:hypothetical protein